MDKSTTANKKNNEVKIIKKTGNNVELEKSVTAAYYKNDNSKYSGNQTKEKLDLRNQRIQMKKR